MANLSFSVFANSLAEELGSENYLCFTSLEEALVVVSLASRQPTLTVCLKEHATRKCSIWKCLLNDEAMLHHMEDDVGIYDPTGLMMFSSYFCDALLGGVSIVRSNAFYPLKADAPSLALRLIYNVGSMRLEGLLRLSALQKDMDELVFEMMQVAAKVRLDAQVTRASRAAKPKAPVPASFVIRKEGLGEDEAEAAAADEQDPSAPAKAKKRKAVGVTLFANKKK